MRDQILESVDRFIHDKIQPLVQHIDDSDTFPHELYKGAAEIGLCAIWVPTRYGGIDTDLLTQLLIVERMSRVCPSFALTLASCGDGSAPILNGGSEAQKAALLPGVASGSVIPCFALSEPGVGSDAASIQTKALREGGEYVLNGTKMWCTNGTVGDIYTVFAKTDLKLGSKGISAFLVKRDQPGFSIGTDEPLIGLRGSDITQYGMIAGTSSA